MIAPEWIEGKDPTVKMAMKKVKRKGRAAEKVALPTDCPVHKLPVPAAALTCGCGHVLAAVTCCWLPTTC